MPDPLPTAPNHHADHPGFSGITGVVAGLSMLIGRGGVARLVAELADVGGLDHVVDVGCGPGAAAREAARRGARVSAVDPAPVMLAIARRLSRTERISWLQGVAEALPVADDSATVLWSIATVHHWPDLDGGLTEAFRVLNGGGQLLAVERRAQPGARGLASHGWTEAQAESFAQRCLAAGFAEVHVGTHGSGRRRQLVVRANRPDSTCLDTGASHD